MTIENQKKGEITDDNNISLIDELKNVNLEVIDKSEINEINNLFESYDSIFRFDKDYKKNPLLKPSDSDIVIHDSFLLSLINLDVFAESEISTLFFSLVDKMNWIKDE